MRNGMAPLLRWRDKPEGPIEPLQTNWTVVPASTNAAPEEIVDYSFERALRITPSVAEIMRQVSDGPEYKNNAGQTVQIGKLRFSDGTQTEKAYTLGADNKVIQFDARMPVGAMLGARENAESQLGGRNYTEAETEQSNLYFAHMLGTIEPRYVKRTKKRNGKNYTAREAQAHLEEAIANTKVMPPVKRYKAGLPCATKRIADAFVGMQKGKKGESGAVAWEDIASAMVSREVWKRTLEELSDTDIGTLDATMTAKNMHSVGSAIGMSDYYARNRGGGKRALIAANDNLKCALKRSA